MLQFIRRRLLLAWTDSFNLVVKRKEHEALRYLQNADSLGQQVHKREDNTCDFALFDENDVHVTETHNHKHDVVNAS